MINSKTKGNISEAKVLTALLAKNIPVLIPFGDNQRYDLVADNNGIFMRIQCKTGRMNEDKSVLDFPTSSSYAHRGGKRKSYVGDIDAFAVYCEYTDKVYLIPIEKCGTAYMTLRLTAPKNGQVKNIQFAKDFEI